MSDRPLKRQRRSPSDEMFHSQDETSARLEKAPTLSLMDLDPAWICPLTNMFFKDPVFVLADNKHYERKAIVDYIAVNQRTPQGNANTTLEDDQEVKDMILGGIREFCERHSQVDFSLPFTSSRAVEVSLSSEKDLYLSPTRLLAHILNRLEWALLSSLLPSPTGPPSLGGNTPPAAPPPELLCPITHQLMRDPVMALDGCVYERTAITDWFNTHNTSPVTELQLRELCVKECEMWREICDEWRRFLRDDMPAAVLTSRAAPSSRSLASEFVSTWISQINELRDDLFRLTEWRVGVLGVTGMGKSSLLNALLTGTVTNEREVCEILPVSCGGEAVTRVVIEARYGPDLGYRLKLHFLGIDEWKAIIEGLILDVTDHVTEDEEEEYIDFRGVSSCQARTTLQAIFGDEVLQFAGKSPADFRKFLESADHPYTYVGKPPLELPPCDSSYEVAAQLREYTMPSPEKMAWPFIAKAEILGPFDICREGIVLVDLPGIQDTNECRNRIAKAALRKCDTLLVTNSASRFLSGKGLEECLSSIPSAPDLAMSSKHLSRLAFVATRADDIPKAKEVLLWPTPGVSEGFLVQDFASRDPSQQLQLLERGSLSPAAIRTVMAFFHSLSPLFSNLDKVVSDIRMQRKELDDRKRLLKSYLASIAPPRASGLSGLSAGRVIWAPRRLGGFLVYWPSLVLDVKPSLFVFVEYLGTGGERHHISAGLPQYRYLADWSVPVPAPPPNAEMVWCEIEDVQNEEDRLAYDQGHGEAENRARPTESSLARLGTSTSGPGTKLLAKKDKDPVAMLHGKKIADLSKTIRDLERMEEKLFEELRQPAANLRAEHFRWKVPQDFAQLYTKTILEGQLKLERPNLKHEAFNQELRSRMQLEEKEGYPRFSAEVFSVSSHAFWRSVESGDSVSETGIPALKAYCQRSPAEMLKTRARIVDKVNNFVGTLKVHLDKSFRVKGIQAQTLKLMFDSLLAETVMEAASWRAVLVADVMKVVEHVLSFSSRAREAATREAVLTYRDAMWDHVDNRKLHSSQIPAILRRDGVYSTCLVDVNAALAGSYKSGLAFIWDVLTGHGPGSVGTVFDEAKNKLADSLFRLHNKMKKEAIAVFLNESSLDLVMGKTEDIRSPCDTFFSECRIRLNAVCDEALDSLTKLITDQMSPGYNSATRKRGVGMVAAMTKIMEDYISKNAKKIFAETAQSVEFKLRQLEEELLRAVDENLDRLWVHLKNKFAPLWLENTFEAKHVANLLKELDSLQHEVSTGLPK